MIITLCIAALWLLCGLAALIWFHRWRAGSGYVKRWHMVVDYVVVVLLGPVSLLIMRRRDSLGRISGGGDA